MASFRNYLLRVLIAFDMFVNVIINGRFDETISSHSGRAALKGKLWGILMSKFLGLFQKNHVLIAQQSDLDRARAIEKTLQASLSEEL